MQVLIQKYLHILVIFKRLCYNMIKEKADPIVFLTALCRNRQTVRTKENMKDLTCGRPIKLIVLFALPLLFGNLFQQAYNLADIVIIGQNLSNDSIAAVGSTAPLVSLMFNIINGLVTGFSIVVAKNFGAGEYDEMRRTIARMLVFASAVTAVLILLSTVFIDPLLRLLDVRDDIFAEARSYLFVVALGLVVTLLYNFEASILRAVGDSVIPLIILILSTALNIGLDLLLICVFKAGVVGAALATVAAQAVSAAVCLVYLIKRRPMLLVKCKDFTFTAESTKELLGAGLGMALMYSIVDIGSIVLQNGINGFGKDVITAHTAARKIFGLTIMPYSAVSATLVTYCSQNRGMERYSRIRRGIRDGLMIMFAWSAIAVALIFFAGDALIGMIVSSEGENAAAIIDTGVLYMKWAVPFYFALAALLGLRSALQGLGKSLVPIICSVIELLWKIVTVVVMIPLFGGSDGGVGSTIEEIGGYFGVVISEPIVWTVCAIIIGIIAFDTLRKMPKDDVEK